MTDDLYLIADELRALANLGLEYAESVHGRYGRGRQGPYWT